MNFTTRTHRGATGRMPAQLHEREDRRPALRVFAFSAVVVEDGIQARHYAGYKVGYDIDAAYREAMAECFRSFPLSHGYEGHSVEIVEVHGVQLEVRR